MGLFTVRALTVAMLMVCSGCQCVPLPSQLKCTPDACGPGERCGEDGQCQLRVEDAGCTPVRSCQSEGRECGALQTGCAEIQCGACAEGQSCGLLQPGHCAACDFAAFDAPDPDFVDSNCDGLDGTVDGGLFLDPMAGDDFSPGSRAFPIKTLSRAAFLATQQPGAFHTVFIAEGGLAGMAWRVPVSLAGGYRAGSWIRSNTVVTTVSSGGVGLQVESVPASVGLSRLTIVGTTGASGTATVGLTLIDAPVMLQGLVIRAGDGAGGLAGRAGAQGTPGLPGAPGGLGTAGQGGCKFCTDLPGVTAGGEGGTGACGTGLPGEPSAFVSDTVTRPEDVLFQRATLEACSACPCPQILPAMGLVHLTALDGSVGTDGAGGDAGVDALLPVTATAGSLSGGVWQPAVAAAGGDAFAGVPADGGGAGGDVRYQLADPDSGALPLFKSIALGSSGGGGGAPGCGGRGGEGGWQGGASIGLVVVRATPRFDGVEIFTGRGGQGGEGGAGGPGGAGGAGGLGGSRWEATCVAGSGFRLSHPGAAPSTVFSGFVAGAGGPGGRGGNGGPGGAGAPGVGGSSIGVWCEGVSLTTLPVVTLGAAGPGGERAGAQSPAGLVVGDLDCR